MVYLRCSLEHEPFKVGGRQYVMKRLYTRVSDDEYLDYKVAITSAGLTTEEAIRKGLNILLFNPKTLENDHVRESDPRSTGSEEDQEAGEGN